MHLLRPDKQSTDMGPRSSSESKTSTMVVLVPALMSLIIGAFGCDSRASKKPQSFDEMLATSAKTSSLTRFSCAPANASGFTGYSANLAVGPDSVTGKVIQSQGGTAFNRWRLDFKVDPSRSVCSADRLVQKGRGGLSYNGQVVRKIAAVEVNLEEGTTVLYADNDERIAITTCQNEHLATRCGAGNGDNAVAQLTTR